MLGGILLLGGTGYLGSALATKLGVLKRPLYVLSRNSATSYDQSEVGGIAVSREYLCKESVPIEMVINCLANYSETDRSESGWANAYLPSSILASTTWCGSPVFINVDSYYSLCLPEHTPNPLYTYYKREFVSFATKFSDSKGISFINCRLFSPYGLNSRREDFISSIVRRCRSEKQITLRGFKQIRDYIFLSDVVDALVLVAQNSTGLSNKYFEIGSGTGISVGELVDQIVDRLGIAPIRKNSDPVSYIIDNIDFIADTRPLISLNWKPKIDLNNGLSLAYF